MSDLDTAREARGRLQRRSKLRITRKTPRKRFRGTPPPPSFDLYALHRGTMLDKAEVAAAVRRGISTVEFWMGQPGHPLARANWVFVAGRWLLDVEIVRALLKGTER